MNRINIADPAQHAASCEPQPLEALHFESVIFDALPGDPLDDHRPRQVSHAAYSAVRPTPVAAPRLLAWSDELALQLGIARPATTGAAVDILAGNALAPGMRPYAARYGGHQFGHWAGQLGDGRAISLGELPTANVGRQELQLKGAGMTPYSRHADGRAVLRSSLREFLCSEAMHSLGIPTTRALSLVATGESVVRDMFYDGRPEPEPGAIVCRVAPSFIRFGNFEIHAANGEHELLRKLADLVIRRHYPEFELSHPGVYAAWFAEVCRRTAIMIAHWMRVGFVHGVMNTDNMSILGLTMDYGPYGWLEGYDPDWTPNTTDAAGRRYAYGRQPQIALWNLARLAGALMPLIGDEAPLQAALEQYRDTYAATWRGMLAAKLGWEALGREGDEALIEELFTLLAAVETDMPIFFRELATLTSVTVHRDALPAPLAAALYDNTALSTAQLERWQAWLGRWLARSAASGLTALQRRERMDAVNPRYLPRNYLAQEAIDAATEGDMQPLEDLLAVMRQPYEEQRGRERYAARRPEWARHRAGCSALSCSS